MQIHKHYEHIFYVNITYTYKYIYITLVHYWIRKYWSAIIVITLPCQWGGEVYKTDFFCLNLRLTLDVIQHFLGSQIVVTLLQHFSLPHTSVKTKLVCHQTSVLSGDYKQVWINKIQVLHFTVYIHYGHSFFGAECVLLDSARLEPVEDILIARRDFHSCYILIWFFSYFC